MARSLPRITALTLCAAAIGHLTIAFGFAADTETAGIAISLGKLNYRLALIRLVPLSYFCIC